MTKTERTTAPAPLRPRVHRRLVEAIALPILRGDWPPGHALPPEADLCDTLGISRSALRESIRTLKEKGLLEGRPRAGTKVRARRDWNLIDEDILTWLMDCPPNPDLVRSLIEARQVIEPASARFAAMRAQADDIAALKSAYGAMAEAKAVRDFATFNLADIDFHLALLRASGNVVFQQLTGIIGAALAYAFRLSIESAKEPGASLPEHGVVISCIVARDSAGAARAMETLLGIALIDLGLE